MILDDSKDINQSIDPKKVVQERSFDLLEGGERRKINEGTTQDIEDLVEKIEEANLQLSKLMELNKAKEDMIRNLERKLDKILLV